MVICSCRKEHSKNVHKYFSGVGFTGIKNFLKANHWLAGLFWAIIITTGAVIAIYMTVLIVLNFVSSPTVTKIDILVTQDVIYPTITVCDSAGSYFLDDLKLRSANISRLQIGSLLLLAPLFILPKPDEPYQHWANVSDELIIEMQSKWKESGKKSESEAIWDFFHSFSVECDQIFVDCKNADFISFNCCEVFRPVLRPGYGICFSSDKTKMPTAQSPQLFSSLFLMFGTPSLFSPTGSSTTVRNPLEITLDDGVDQSVWRPDFIQLDFGFTTTVTLDILRIEEENSPENACLEDAELETFQDYTYDNCMWEKRFFLNTKFQEMLSCSLAINELTKLNFVNKKLSKNRSPKDPVCNFATIKRVIFHNFDDPKLFESGSRRLIEYWFQHLNMSDENPCKDMCDSWEYKWTKTQEQNAPANVSQLILTVGNIMYPVVQEVPSMEWQDFLGIIGGTWGLWFGASVLSFIQLFLSLGRFICGSKLTQKDKNLKYNLTTKETSFSYVTDKTRNFIPSSQ